MKITARPLLGALLLALTLPAVAYDPVGYGRRDYDYYNRFQDGLMNQFQYDLVDPVRKDLNRRQREAAAKERETAPIRAAATTYTPVQRDGAAIEPLVTAYPTDAQGKVRREFTNLLGTFRKLEKQFGLPANDVATAVAAYLAGSYAAYTDVTLPDAHFKPLVAQMRRALQDDAQFAKASDATRQQMYEQLVTLGMLMTVTQLGLQQNPDARLNADMRAAGGNYLASFLGVPASRVRITAQGLELE